jgi:hypothetical protein
MHNVCSAVWSSNLAEALTTKLVHSTWLKNGKFGSRRAEQPIVVLSVRCAACGRTTLIYTSYLLCIVCATFPQSSQGRSLPTSRATCPESILSTAPPRRFMCIKLCSPRRINFFVSRAHTHMHISRREKSIGVHHTVNLITTLEHRCPHQLWFCFPVRQRTHGVT